MTICLESHAEIARRTAESYAFSELEIYHMMGGEVIEYSRWGGQLQQCDRWRAGDEPREFTWPRPQCETGTAVIIHV